MDQPIQSITSYMEHGMTLRDYFAAAALQGRGTEWGEAGVGYDGIAKYCYDQADAMLEARKVKT